VGPYIFAGNINCTPFISVQYGQDADIVTCRMVVITLCLNIDIDKYTDFPSNTNIHLYCNSCSPVAVKMNGCVQWKDFVFF